MKEIAFISGKGGTGKSSISAAIATLGQNIVLADCDVDTANLHILFNPEINEEIPYIGSVTAVIDYSKCNTCEVCINSCKFDAIAMSQNKVIINPISCDGCYLCYRICPLNAINMIKNDKSRLYSGSFRYGKMLYGRIAPGEENSGKLVNLVREKAKKIAKENNIKTIIIDGPPGIGCPVISAITGVDKVVIITEPTVSGISDMIRAVEITRKLNINPFIIINKNNLNEKVASKIKKWCNDHYINILGELPFEKQIVNAMVNKKSIIEWNKDLIISILIKEIYNKIILN